MDDETRRGLTEAADAVLNGPERLRSLIVAAGRRGVKPSQIHRVIFPAYTYEYIARLIRADRAAQAGPDGKAA